MICVIAAVSENNVIGNKGKIPWYIPEDFAHFKEITMGNILIMGRKTFEEIGHPLPGRFTIIVSKNLTKENRLNSDWKNCSVATSFEEALELAEKITKGRGLSPKEQLVRGQTPNEKIERGQTSYTNKDIFICGGASIFEKGLSVAEKLYITKIHADFEGDVFFPPIDESLFDKKILTKTSETTEKNEDFPYDFLVYSRK